MVFYFIVTKILYEITVFFLSNDNNNITDRYSSVNFLHTGLICVDHKKIPLTEHIFTTNCISKYTLFFLTVCTALCLSFPHIPCNSGREGISPDPGLPLPHMEE